MHRCFVWWFSKLGFFFLESVSSLVIKIDGVFVIGNFGCTSITIKKKDRERTSNNGQGCGGR